MTRANSRFAFMAILLFIRSSGLAKECPSKNRTNGATVPGMMV
jgi:hypothetical protein